MVLCALQLSTKELPEDGPCVDRNMSVCNVILIYFNVDIITKSASVGF